jgi:hypothetical protein
MIKEPHSKALPRRGKSEAGPGVAALNRKIFHWDQEGIDAWNGAVGLVKSAGCQAFNCGGKMGWCPGEDETLPSPDGISSLSVGRAKASYDDSDIIPPAVFVRFGHETFASNLWLVFGLKNGCNTVVRNHPRQAIRTQKERVVRLQLNPVALHQHPRIMAPDNIGNDVAEAMLRGFFRLKLASAYHLLNKRMVVRQALEFPAAEQIAAAVADMNHEQVGAETVGHGHCGAHPGKFGMLRRLPANFGIGFLQRYLKLLEDAVLLSAFEQEEPFERVECERLDGFHRQSARLFSSLMAPHAVRHDEQVAALGGVLRLGLR